MFARLWRELAATDALVAQAHADPRDPLYAELLATGGLRLAADLVYMAAEPESFPAAPVEPRLALEPFAAGDDGRLIRLIDRTYVGTLDCPSIDGLRQTADVIAGYRAVGDFNPARWLFAMHDHSDVGCLLVNVHSDVGHAEIVYLGIVPEVRGRGHGLELTRHALWLARQAACERAVLAVDGNNHPAVEMYGAAGFVPFDRRSVWFRTLP
jgi:ribosomal protein S18 acetylase RimI-like enzyme